MIEVSKNKIKCSTFSAREKFIQELNHDIWRASPKAAGELASKAHTLFIELDILSGCPKYNQENPGCRICKAICNLRKQNLVYPK